MSELALHTRGRNQVGNFCDPHEETFGLTAQSAELKRQYFTAFHRSTEPTETYNCHGLTFGARRTRIFKTSEVRKILIEDEYQPIAAAAVEPGDVIVYFDDSGEAEHSGIVVELGKLNDAIGSAPVPKILSKWGSCHEVVHFFNDCPYSLRNIQYFRMKR